MDLRTSDGTGKTSGVLFGQTLWRATCTVECLTDDASIDAAAYINSLKGSVESILFLDPMRLLPRYYRRAGTMNSVDTVGTFTLNTNRDVITCAGLANNIVLQRGDLIGIKDATGYKCTVAELMEGATTSGGGFSATVFPAVPVIVDSWTTPVMYLERPAVTMRLTPETSIGETSPEGRTQHVINALQYLPD